MLVMVSCYGWSRSSLHLLCLSLLVQEVLCQEVVNIVILPDQIIIFVVIGVIFLGLCVGVGTCLWRNRRDIPMLLPEWLMPGPKMEEASEADRIAFEKAEQRRMKRELREAAQADLEAGGGSGDLELPETLPGHVADEKNDGEDSRGTSLPLPGSKMSAASAVTDSMTSSQMPRRKRKSSRNSEPGGRPPRPAPLEDVAASEPLSRWKARKEYLEGTPQTPEEGENLPSVSSKDRKGRRHSVSGAAPELAQLATPLATPTGTPGASSMTMKAFGRKMPTSGPWEGSVQERGSKRPSQYKLRFLPDQRVAGSTDGPDGTAQISGSFNPENHRVIWTESHPWGSVKVTGHVFYKAHVAQISGTFTASDGGKGKLELSPSGS